jgi:hypothetical protein
MIIPVDIGREQAAELARSELSDPAYEHESWWGRLIQDVLDWLNNLVGPGAALSGGLIALIILTAVLCLIAFFIIRAVNRGSRPSYGSEAIFGGDARSAAEHRAAAEEHAAAGQWALAIQERLRAIARDLEERVIVEPVPGRTADEFAAEAALALPSFGDRLTSAARLFDEVAYGGRSGTPDGYASVRDLDDHLRTARPQVTA